MARPPASAAPPPRTGVATCCPRRGAAARAGADSEGCRGSWEYVLRAAASTWPGRRGKGCGARGVIDSGQGGEVVVAGSIQVLLRPGQRGFGVHDVGGRRVASLVLARDQAEVLPRLGDRRPGQGDVLAGRL